ncbi:MAG: hypothetical protein KKD35_00235, partial [Elusimicrobia bacterium]|nr:hypothetical protein [Elusimicrobiota bacterium]
NNLLLSMSGHLKCEYEFLKSFSDEINKFCISLGYHFSNLNAFQKVKEEDYFTYILNSSLASNMRLSAKLVCLYKADKRFKNISKLIDALVISKDLSNEIKLLEKSKNWQVPNRKRFSMSIFKNEKDISIMKMTVLVNQNDRKLETLLKKKNLSFLTGFADYFKIHEFDVYE